MVAITIEKKNPLKQGLKHKEHPTIKPIALIEKKNPLKQGLKQNQPTLFPVLLFIEKKNPLKQGLKLESYDENEDDLKLKRRIH